MKTTLVILCLIVSSALIGQTYEVQLIDVNTQSDEYAPVLIDGTLVFCSDRRTDFTKAEFDKDDKYSTHWYAVNSGKVTSFQLPYDPSFHLGPIAISPDSQKICFSATMPHDKRQEGMLGLFFSERLPGGWSAPVPFEWNTSDNSYNITHPAYSRDGRYLFFSSDQPGTVGKADIFRSARNGDSWDKPENLGLAVNTTGTDIFPSCTPDGKLWFATDSIAGCEGFDIFFINEKEENRWTLPVRADAPLNSEFNDYNVVFRDQSTGYLVSDRNREGLDLFSFTIGFPEFGPCEEAWPAATCYLIEETEFQPVDTLPLRYEWDFGDGTRGIGLSNEHCFPGLGTYNVELNVFDTIANSHFGTISELEIRIESSGLPLITASDTVSTNSIFTMLSDDTELNGFPNENWFWIVSDGRKFADQNVEISFEEPGDYMVSVGVIIDPTDAHSPRRCSSKRIVVRDAFEPTYVEAAPSIQSVAPAFENADSLTYFVEFHESPERVALTDSYFGKVQYEITERFQEHDSLFHYSVGADERMSNLYGLRQELLDSGYVNSIVRREEMNRFNVAITQVGSFYSEEEQMELNDKVQQLADIQFETNSATLTETSVFNLELISDIMSEELLLYLDISAHTDDVGRENYNQNLSEKRAEAVVGYLVKSGISAARLHSEGFGSSQPKANNDTEEGRTQNRRVELKLKFGN
ncbi:MAG: OmpA family protein [Cryomorphaceae bacterium]|nr:OmpA family protein [Cryomorphaceae bacterium]